VPFSELLGGIALEAQAIKKTKFFYLLVIKGAVEGAMCPWLATF